jgi:hypothetical protein
MKADTKKAFVNLTGGLGNQLFQIAHALNDSNLAPLLVIQEFGKPRLNNKGEAEIFSFNLPFVFTTRKVVDAHRILRHIIGHTLKISEQPEKWEKYILYRFLFTIISNCLLSVYFRKLIVISTRSHSNSSTRKIIGTNFYLGYFQGIPEKDIESTRTALKGLRIKEKSKELQDQIDYALKNRIIFIHVRLMDYFDEPNIGLLSKKYFEDALSRIDLEADIREIWVFSDDHALAKRTLTLPIEVKTRFISESEFSVSETFELMRYGSHYILSNSTFGWWAAFLSEKQDVQVVIPEPWFKSLYYDANLYVPGWQKQKAQWRFNAAK